MSGNWLAEVTGLSAGSDGKWDSDIGEICRQSIDVFEILSMHRNCGQMKAEKVRLTGGLCMQGGYVKMHHKLVGAHEKR